MLTQEVRQNSCRYAEGIVLTVTINAWGGQQQFAWVDKVLMLGIAFKAVPAFARYKVEEAQVVGDLFGFKRLP